MIFFLDIVWIPNYNCIMNEQDRYNELIKLTFRVMNKFQAVEKIAQRFGTEEELYPREIHTIQAIGNHPDINITDLASRLGITKGTISPIVTRLAKKKFVSKLKGIENNKEVLLRLTPKGEVAYHAHEMFEHQVHSRLYDILEKSSSDNLDFLGEFLRVSESIMDEHLREIA
jgi:DNA-binding MarR family transcriptional regulator